MEELRATSNPAFRFVVEIEDKAVAAFTECTLPVVEWEMQEVKEGGVNTHVHMLPGRRKRATLTLKNGVGLAKELVDWYLACMGEKFEFKNISIYLLSGPGQKARKTTMSWKIANCMPIKWTGPQLKASDNTIAIQTLEMACGEITCEVPREVMDKTGWEPKPHTVPPARARVKNAKNGKLIPPHVVSPERLRAVNPKNPGLVPTHTVAPDRVRAPNPKNKGLIAPHVVPPDRQRAKKK